MTIKHIATKSITRMHQGASLLYGRAAAVLLTAAVGLLVAPSASAQTVYTSDEINKAILLPGSLQPEWIQDETKPWKFMGPNMEGLGATTSSRSSIYFKFKSEYPIILQYKTPNNYWPWLYNGSSQMGVNMYNYGFHMVRLEAGEYNLEFRGANDSGDKEYFYDFGIFELKDELNAAQVAAKKSLPFEIVNDKTNSWFITEDKLCSSRIGGDVGSTEITFSFECEKVCVLSWNFRNVYERNFNYDYCYYYDWDWGFDCQNVDCLLIGLSYQFYDNDILIKEFEYLPYSTGWFKTQIAFRPGKHNFKVVVNQKSQNNSSGYSNMPMLKNIRLSDEWFTVETEPGDLGNSVIDEINKYGYNYLTDVNLLKIKGTLNSTDFAHIAQMTNLQALDIKETTVVDFPPSLFKDNNTFSYIVLPDGLKTIGDEAFKTCNITELTIPASVEKIGNQAFAESSISKLEFEQNSKINSIGYCAFNRCKNLKSVSLPDNQIEFPLIKSYDRSFYTNDGSARYEISAVFGNCTSLEFIKFPESMAKIPQSICYGTTNLKTVILPKNLNTIHRYSFENSGITSIEFPQTLRHIYSDAFSKTTVPAESYELRLPESVVTINENAFQCCGAETIYLPLKLEKLETNAFKGCSNLRTIRLHGNATNLPNFLTDCPKLETIILPCATPPTRAVEEIMGTQNKKAISLIVPEFAQTSYRLDDYWYLFGNINSGDQADNQNYWNVTGELSLREGRRMKGKPDVTVSANGGSMRILGTTAAQFGELTVCTNSTNPASVVNKCPAIKADKATNRFEATANTWYFFTPLFDTPLADVKFTSECNSVFRYYDSEGRAANGKSGNWKNVAEGETLKAGKGYIFQCDADCTVIFPGDASAAEHVLDTTERNLALTSHDSENAAHADWNFIGNPYPSYFDIWYLDVDAPITVYSDGKYVAKSITDDNYVLRPMEAFFVQKPTADAKALFTLDGRQVNANIRETRAAMPSRLHASAAGRRVFNLELTDAEGNALDQTRVVINERASEDYERSRDAAKFAAMTADEAQLYTIDAEGNRLAINERPLANGEVALGIATGATGELTLSAARADGKVSLLDTKTGLTADLTEAPATILAEPGRTIDGRYRLLFRPAETTAAEEAEAAGVRVIGGAGEISVSNPAGAEVLVCAADGTVIRASADKELRVAARPGVHIVRVGEAAFKVIVR